MLLGSSGVCLLLCRMAWSSGCSRIPKPETKGGPGDEDAFEDGLGNRNARLQEVPALHGTSGSLPGGPESGMPPSQVFRGTRDGTDLSGALDDGEVGGT